MQEDKPKIVITGPAAKAGQVNRGYDVLNNYHVEDHMEVSPTSDWSFISNLDLSPSIDSANLAARGKIAKSISPSSQLQIPSGEKMSVASVNSSSVPDKSPDISGDRLRRNGSAHSYSSAHSFNSPAHSYSSAHSYNSAYGYEENNNVFDRSRSSVTTMFTSTSSVEYHTPTSSPISVGSSKGGASPRKIDISKSRTRRPFLVRQNAEEVLEMANLEPDNQHSLGLSTKKSNF